jgi:DNA-binding CsgD family transcriptional regulator
MHTRTTSVTPREEEICALVTKGLTNAEIAQVLEVSRHTVSTHLARVFAKLGIRSRNRLSFFIQKHYNIRGHRLVRKARTRKPFCELTMMDTQRVQP